MALCNTCKMIFKLFLFFFFNMSSPGINSLTVLQLHYCTHPGVKLLSQKHLLQWLLMAIPTFSSVLETGSFLAAEGSLLYWSSRVSQMASCAQTSTRQPFLSQNPRSGHQAGVNSDRTEPLRWLTDPWRKLFVKTCCSVLWPHLLEVMMALQARAYKGQASTGSAPHCISLPWGFQKLHERASVRAVILFSPHWWLLDQFYPHVFCLVDC